MQEFLNSLRDREVLTKPLTLVIGLVVIILFAATVDGFVSTLITNRLVVRQLIYAVMVIVWIGYWLGKNYLLPRTRKNRLGIVIAIHTENKEVRSRLENDFVANLQKLIDNHALRSAMQLILLEDHQAKRVSKILQGEQANLTEWRNTNNSLQIFPKMVRLLNRMRAKVYIWGSIVERHEGELKYFFDSNLYIVHRPIGKYLHTALAIDFSNVWQSPIDFAKTAEYSGFLFSASQIYLAAKYCIGVAAGISHDLFTALALHESLKEELQSVETTDSIKYLCTRLEALIPAEYSSIARGYLAQGNFAEAQKYLSESFRRDSKNYGGLLTRAILEFRGEHDPEKALATIRLAKNYANHDGSWRYSQGFLLMHPGRFDKALVVYNQIAEYSYENEESTLAQVYVFIEQFINTEPHKIQCYYIIGFLKYRKDGNLPDSLNYFELFLEKANNKDQYRQLIGSAKSYKAEIEAAMQ